MFKHLSVDDPAFQAAFEGEKLKEAVDPGVSENLLSISAIAADLADGGEGSRRSVALALSRMADGVHLMVERVLDQHEALAQAKV